MPPRKATSSSRVVIPAPAKQSESGSSRVLRKKKSKTSQKRKRTEESSEPPGVGSMDDMKKAVEVVGISVGAKTKREKLLDLLNKHVRKKVPRISKQPRVTSTPTSDPMIDEPGQDQSTTGIDPNDNANQHTDFSMYDDLALSNMLRGVGLDTKGFDREALVHNCKMYQELIVLPKFTLDLRGTNPSEERARSLESQRRTPEASTSQLPSIEHGRRPFPRPHPTVPLSSSPTQRKQKGKAKETFDDDPDWIQSEGDIDSNHFGHTNLDADDTDENEGGSDIRFSVRKNTKSIAQMNTELYQTKKELKTVREELRVLSRVVDKLNKGGPTKEGDEVEPRGGRTSSWIRFHVETMLGLRKGESDLPPPADTQAQNLWDTSINLDNVVISMDPSANAEESGTHTRSVDACFPYIDGPGHKDSNPQQLSIIWQLMKAVNMTSFRPDFAKAYTSRENKWLWEFCLNCFIKLVECGEYPGVSIAQSNRGVIKQHLQSHVRTLMKRYRQDKWDSQRKKDAAANVRRGARLRHLRKLREKVVLSEKSLWPLADMIQPVCSDDDTDEEPGTRDSGNRLESPWRVRRLEWRSQELQHICLRIDSYRVRKDLSMPNTSPGQRTGRPSRPRMRSENAPLSKLPAALGLPVDCYSKQWLDTLSPLERAQLEIQPQTVMHLLIPLVDSLPS